MARERNKEREALILQTAKSLFAEKGFFNTSVSDIVKASKLPVGSIYTYFSSKEDIVKAIIEDGWADLHGRLIERLDAAEDPAEKITLLLDDFLPELFKDIELITILLSEAVDYTRLEEKLEELTDIVFTVIKEHEGGRSFFGELSGKEMRAAFIIYFLGVLHTVKIAKSGNIDLSVPDILGFLRNTIRKTLYRPD